MSPAVTPQVIKDYILPTVQSLVADPIPNIRFNVAKSLETLAPLLRASADTAPIVESDVRPALAKLNEDSDNDVRYFAHRALVTGELVFFFFGLGKQTSKRNYMLRRKWKLPVTGSVSILRPDVLMD